MQEIIVKKGLRRTIVVLFDDIEQMPIPRFNKLNKLWMLNDSIGSSISDFDAKHFSNFITFIKTKELDKLAKQLENFRILVFNIQNEINIEHLSFACMVHSIDGEEMTDISDSGLKRTLDRLGLAGLTQEHLKKNKKKFEGKLPTTLKNISQRFLATRKALFFGRNKKSA